MIRQLYRLAAAGCAELVWRVPSLEGPFVHLGPRLWQRPGLGRFYRSAADRLATRLERDGAPFRRVDVEGVSLIVDVTEFTTKWLYFGHAPYEPETTASVRRLLGKGAVFVDVGANHGYFSLLAAAIVGSEGRVVAFEPNPTVFDLLETHVTLNAFGSRMTTLPWALGETVARGVPLFVSQVTTNSGLSSLTPRAELLEAGDLSAARTVPVDVTTFDEWLRTSGLDRVDLVKVDVEGAEAHVVGGMRAALTGRAVDAVICETSWGGAAHQILIDAGYVPRRLEAVGSLENILYTSPKPPRT